MSESERERGRVVTGECVQQQRVTDPNPRNLFNKGERSGTTPCEALAKHEYARHELANEPACARSDVLKPFSDNTMGRPVALSASRLPQRTHHQEQRAATFSWLVGEKDFG